MLPFFPTPYPDELAYSIFARYHIRSSNPSVKATVKDLFGKTTACAVIDLPSRLGYLSSQLPPGTLNTPERLIAKHTLLPLYSLFLPAKRLNKLIGWMKGDARGGSIHGSAGIMASSIPAPRFLRYCPDCLVADNKEHGETYWHRSHQVAGVLLCHKHDAWLLEDDSLPFVLRNKHTFVAAPDLTVVDRVAKRPPNRFFQQYRNIAQAVAWLLNQSDFNRVGPPALLRKYQSHLRRLDLISFAGRVSQKELSERFMSFYEEDFLTDIHCQINQNYEHSWLTDIVRRSDKTHHPLRHILLIHFLGLKLEEFFMEKIRSQLPFGREPWPCLNPVASHYKEFVIKKCVLSRHTVTGKPVGNFYCTCGFNYARTGPDRDRNDRFRRSRMIAFGPVWEEALLRLVSKEKMGLRPASRILGVDFNTVARNFIRLTENKEVQIISTVDEKERQVRRNRWLELMKAHPTASKSELFNMARADEAWLYRHDRVWLSKNVPETKKREKPVDNRVDWAERDKVLAAKVPLAAEQIQEVPGRAIRVTESVISKKLGVVSMFSKHMDKLPLTRVELDKVIETQDDFEIRRIKLAANEILQNGKTLSTWRIIRAASLKPGYSDVVAYEIERIMSTAGDVDEY